MYQFSGKLKTVSLALILLGFLGLAYSFYAGSQNTLEDAKHAIEAANNDAHGNGHAVAVDTHQTAEAHDAHAVANEAHTSSRRT